MAIRLFFGGLGTGKSALLTKFYIENANNAENYFNFLNFLNSIKKLELDIDINLEHLAFSNLEVNDFIHKFQFFNPADFKITCDKDNINIPPYSYIAIDEAQRFFSSRIKITGEESRAFELCRQGRLDIDLFCQRPMLIDINIREITQEFHHIIKFKTIKDRLNRIVKCIWTTKILKSESELKAYLNSTEKERSLFKETRDFIFNGDIFLYYDSYKFGLLFLNPYKEKFDFKLKDFNIKNSKDFIEFIEDNKIKRRLKDE